MDNDDMMITVAATGAALGIGALVKKGMAKGWEKKRGKAPGTPGDENTWVEALVWALVSGIVVSLVRLVAERGVEKAVIARRSSSTSS